MVQPWRRLQGADPQHRLDTRLTASNGQEDQTSWLETIITGWPGNLYIYTQECAFMLEGERIGSWQMKLPGLVVFVHTVRLGDLAVANCCM